MATSRESRKRAVKLSRNIGDRILIGCLALPISVISGLGVWMVATRSRASDDAAKALWKLVIDESLVAILVLSVLSVVWAVAAPRWIESLLQRFAVKAAFAALLFTGILWWMQGQAQNR